MKINFWGRGDPDEGGKILNTTLSRAPQIVYRRGHCTFSERIYRSDGGEGLIAGLKTVLKKINKLTRDKLYSVDMYLKSDDPWTGTCRTRAIRHSAATGRQRPYGVVMSLRRRHERTDACSDYGVRRGRPLLLLLLLCERKRERWVIAQRMTRHWWQGDGGETTEPSGLCLYRARRGPADRITRALAATAARPCLTRCRRRRHRPDR